MCLGIPMRVVEPADHEAWCEGRDGRRLVDLALVGPQPAGAWLLTFLGGAREVLSAESAGQIDRALDALAAVLAGDAAAVDAGFADLVGREPVLPAHLVTAKE
jgi:hydrogenase assembly chaperone HypC/HupF